MSKTQLLEQAYDLFVKQRLKPEEVAKELGLSRRTVYYWVKKYGWCRVRQAKHNFESNFSYEVESMAKSALINILSRACKGENVTKEEVLAVEKLYFDLPKLKTLFSLNANRQGTPQEFVLGLQDAFLDKPKDERKKKNDNWF